MIGLALISILVLLLYADHFAGDTGYFLAIQAAWVIAFALITHMLPKGWKKAVSIGMFLCACFELIDELMGNNLKLFYNDFVGYGIALFTTIYLANKWSNTKRK
jgi:hypothetical protein